MTDPFDRLVALRPPVPDEDGWATSPAGRAALARVHAAPAPKPTWWRRRRFIVPTVVIGLGAAVGAGVAFSSADRTPVADQPVFCATAADREASVGAIAATVGTAHSVIVSLCQADWSQADGPVPPDFALCVYPVARGQVGGAAVAIPSTVAVTSENTVALCQAAGFDPLR